MFNIRIYNKKDNVYFEETFYNYISFIKRIKKLKYSKNFVVTSWCRYA